MKQLARAEFAIRSWDEKPCAEIAGAPKLTRASVTKVYTGDIEGEGKLEYLMAYGHDGSASFVGIERLTGRVGDKHGSFAFQHVGTFEDGVAKSTWSVVPSSGTEDLQGLRGEVSSALGHEKSYPVEFKYELV
jgi:Protein of unknown function (DUF3224)